MTIEVGERQTAVEQCFDKIRLDRQCTLEACDRALDQIEAAERHPAIVQRPDVRRIDCERPVEAFDRFAMPVDVRQHHAAIIKRCDVIGLNGERPVEVADRFLMATEVADIRSFQQQGPRQFVFDCQIELFGITGPIVRVNADDAAGGRRGCTDRSTRAHVRFSRDRGTNGSTRLRAHLPLEL